jgi:RNA polymerase sigma-70 factor (ECF subfamily)
MADRDSLFAAHYPRLFRYFCRAAGSADAARDLTQEVFLRVSRTRVPSATEGELQAWIFRIARNLVLDHHRHGRRHPAPAELTGEPSRAPSQDVNLAVNEALESLPALDRDVFLMREVAGLGYDEIAAACDLTADAVRSRIHRARLQLRQQLSAPIATFQTLATARGDITHETIES